MPYLVVEDFSSTAWNRSQSGIPQARNGVAYGEIAVFRDGENFRGGKTVQPYLREALFDAPEKTFKPFDLQVGVQAALHQDAGSAHFHCFGYLLINGLEVENVTFAGQLALKRPVKGAKAAIFGTEVCVIDIAVDNVGDYALRMQLAP